MISATRLAIYSNRLSKLVDENFFCFCFTSTGDQINTCPLPSLNNTQRGLYFLAFLYILDLLLVLCCLHYKFQLSSVSCSVDLKSQFQMRILNTMARAASPRRVDDRRWMKNQCPTAHCIHCFVAARINDKCHCWVSGKSKQMGSSSVDFSICVNVDMDYSSFAFRHHKT